MEFEICRLEDKLPEVPGIYFLMNDVELCYVGQTVNLKRRIQRHNNSLNEGIYLGDKLLTPNSFNLIYYIEILDKGKRNELEYELIEEFMPKWNYQGMHSMIDYRAIHPDYRPENINLIG